VRLSYQPVELQRLYVAARGRKLAREDDALRAALPALQASLDDFVRAAEAAGCHPRLIDAAIVAAEVYEPDDEGGVIPVIPVLLSCDLCDGNEAEEATVCLPAVPQVGDTLAFWDSGQIDGSASHEEHAEVVAVVWDVARQGRETGRVCVAIRFDGYDAELVRAIMASLR
jgi:hypothetical protein